MPADPPKPPRARSYWGDTQRARAGRAATPPGGTSTSGIPVEVDPEVTPAPRPPPSLDEFEILDRKEQLRVLLATGAANVDAIDRMWPNRHMTSQLEQNAKQLDRVLDSHEKITVRIDQWAALAIRHEALIDERVLPQVDHLASVITGFQESQAARAEQTSRVAVGIENVALSLDRLGGHLGALDKRVEAVEEASAAHDRELRVLSTAVGSQGIGVQSLRDRLDYQDRTAREALIATDAADKRQARIFTRARAVLVAVVSVAVFAAHQFSNFIDWLRAK